MDKIGDCFLAHQLHLCVRIHLGFCFNPASCPDNRPCMFHKHTLGTTYYDLGPFCNHMFLHFDLYKGKNIL